VSTTSLEAYSAFIKEILGLFAITMVAIGGVKALYAFGAKPLMQRVQNHRSYKLARFFAG
jgi:hypothetical protein